MSRDRHIRRTGADYAGAFSNLLPLGLAWPREADSILMKVVKGLGTIWGFVDRRAADLLEIETDPRLTTEMLTDWERAWGLPEPCFVEPTTVEERRKYLVLKMTLLGGQSRAFFIGVARFMNRTIHIREYAPFMAGVSRVGDTRFTDDDPEHFRWNIGPPEMRFYWTVEISDVGLRWFRAASGQAGVDPHLRINLATDLECVFGKWKPAMTQVIFDYSGLEFAGEFTGTP